MLGDALRAAALTALGRFKSKGPALQYLAREFSFDMGAELYKPSEITHTPGKANDEGDFLSRRWEVQPTRPLPQRLCDCLVAPPERERTYFVQRCRPVGRRK